MKRLGLASAFVLAAFAALRLFAADAAPAPATTPGELTFTTHNTVYNAEGSFASWKFTKVDIPDGDITKGVVEIEVDLASVNEKAAKLAAHLRTADFFDVAKYPKAKIVISHAKAAGDKRYEAHAEVDLHGVKGHCLVAFDVVAEKPLTIKGTATLDRTSFKVGAPYDAADKYSPLADVVIGLNAKLQ
jgi:polyisoprenoid-binding protein YceI